MRIVVIGAGIAGSCIARTARERGHNVVVAADPWREPMSRAAVCVLRPDWFTGVERDIARESVAWYDDRSLLTSTVARWTTYRIPDGETRTRTGFYTVHPDAPLIVPDISGRWPVEQGTLLASEIEAADTVVLCRGAHSDVDWPRTWGATTVIPVAEADVSVLFGYEDRPRNALYTAKYSAGEIRFGSSVAKTPEVALDRQRIMEVRAASVGMIPMEGLWRRLGVRLMPGEGLEPFPIRKLGERTWAVEGGGRVGYSFAPVRARQLLDILEGKCSTATG